MFADRDNRFITGESCSSSERGTTSASASVPKRSDCSNGPVIFGKSTSLGIQSPTRSTGRAIWPARSPKPSGCTKRQLRWGTTRYRDSVLDVWSRASGGQLPAEVVQREMQKERNDVQATAQVLLAEAVRLVGQGELAEAAKILTQAREVCRGSRHDERLGVAHFAMVGDDPPLAMARGQLSSSRIAVANCCERARQAARQALSVARKFQTDLPHALREAGLVAAMQGSVRKARKLSRRKPGCGRTTGRQVRTCPDPAGSGSRRHGSRLAGGRGRCGDCSPGPAFAGRRLRARRGTRERRPRRPRRPRCRWSIVSTRCSMPVAASLPHCREDDLPGSARGGAPAVARRTLPAAASFKAMMPTKT